MKVTKLTQRSFRVGSQLLLILATVLTQARSAYAQVTCLPPVISCPPSITITLDAGECGVVLELPTITAFSNCTPVVDVEQTGGIIFGESFPIGVNTVYFTAFDTTGLFTSCAFDVTIVEFPNAVGTVTCNDEVQISIDQDGIVIVGADDVLEGGPYGCYDDLLVTIHDADGNQFGNTLNCDNIGDLLTVKVMNPENNNACWGTIVLEDKLPPVLFCPNWTVSCTRTIESVDAPLFFDNCDSSPDLVLVGITDIDTDICDDNLAQYQRHWKVTDIFGNTSTCTDIITVERPTEVDFPNDKYWLCTQVNSNPGLVNATRTGSGIPSNVSGGFCNFDISFSDDKIFTCPGTTRAYDIVRTWTVIDWCVGEPITVGVGGEDNVQLIHVADTIAPVINANSLIVDANIPGVHPLPCRSTEMIPNPSVTDNCTGIANININTQVGEVVNGHIPAPGLPIGYHIVTIQAFDRCGNVATKEVVLQVTDRIAPTPICVEYTDVSLETSGKAEVPAEAFNLASNDNCCVESFQVRRMNEDPCDDGHNDLEFGPSVVFCCDDAGKSITVVLRVFDCFGNFNDCMVQVLVNDKQLPVLVSCPPNQRVTCDFYADNIETQIAALTTPAAKSEYLNQFFGEVVFFDNCSVDVKRNITINIDQCLEGTISRSFTANDFSGNTSIQPCTQTINVDHVSDWAVEFPADLTINCGTNTPSFGEPEIFYETCELVAVTYDDEYVNVVADACYKIVRTWTLINWCVVGAEVDQEVVEQPENQLGLALPQCDIDGDGDCDARTFRDSWRGSVPVPNPFAPTAYRLRPFANDAHTPNTNPALNFRNPDSDIDTDPWDGYITYQQTIKVTDTVDPIFTNGCTIPKVCIEDNSCDADILLPTPEITDCSDNVSITAQIKLGNIWVSGLGPHANIPTGVYDVIYTAQDNCNNQTVCNSTVEVKDCKKPTPYCKNGIIVALMNSTPPMVEVWASDLDDSSYDNCDTDLVFSFGPDTTKTSLFFNCINQNSTTFVDVWVTDDCGNQDFCSTQITIQDNVQGCADPLVNSIQGRIATENDEGVENVEVHLNGVNTDLVKTDENGDFLFSGLTIDGDYTVVPSKDDAPLNGVSTFDLVLISKHILGVTPLGSPYKIIAADANRSNSVTTFDLVEIRKLILFMNDDFPNNTSWRFVNKEQVFPNPANPWSTPLQELNNINDFATSIADMDFIGIKIGDVNGSAAANNFGSLNEERKGEQSLLFSIEDIVFEKGQSITIPFSAQDMELLGFQFTLNFNKNKLEFVDIEAGIASKENFGFAKLEEGALTASWNNVDGTSTSMNGVVFNLVFKANAAGKLSETLSINSLFTEAEAYNKSNEILDVMLQFKGHDSAKGYALYQNTPNPFNGVTTVGFNLPKPLYCTISFTDVSGKVLKVVSGEFASGSNQIIVKRNELKSSGVVYYRLETADFTDTKLMVLTD